ncbi:MAG: hypothetical protein MUP97_13045, partial [Acidimicrobiia bacterium]|nr:hypothetical protein [Acidimicrobiia bacterium]
IAKTTMVGTAVAASGCALITQPGAPFVRITDCPPGALCRDGYTEFCCVINNGINACPGGSVASGWWRADYSVYCNGTRYYIDCNDFGAPPPCQCGNGCDTRKVYCNHFRYGQCNQWIGGTGVIACRMVTCVPPFLLDLGCSPSGAVDNATAGHYTDCAPYAPAPPPPPPPPPPVPPPLPVMGSGASAVTPVAGTVAALSRLAGGSVGYVRYAAGAWGAFTDLGQAVGSTIETVATGGGAMRVVARAPDRTFVTAATSDGLTWSAWDSLGGSLTSNPSAVLVGSQVVVVGRGTDNSYLWGGHDGSSWSGWQSLGGWLDSDPALASNGTTTWVIGRGGQGRCYANRLASNAWGGWQPLDGFVTSDLAAAMVANHAYVFARSLNADCFVQHFDGSSWSGWQALGGAMTSDPAAVADGAGRVYVFCRGNDNGLWFRRLVGGSWSGWQGLGGLLTSDPAVAADGNALTVVARWNDNALWSRRFDGTNWLPWGSVGGSLDPANGLG